MKRRLPAIIGQVVRAIQWLVFSVTVGFAQTAEPGLQFFPELDTGGHSAFVRDLSFSADGDWLISASDDRTVRIWDWRAGVTIRTLRSQVGEGAEGKINAAAMSPDGRLVATGGVFGPVASGGPYGDVRVFDTRSGQMAAVLKGLDRPVTTLAFSPDGSVLAAGDGDGYLDLWHRDEAAESGWRRGLHIDTGASGLRRAAFVLGGSRLATASGVAGFALWDVSTGARIDVDPDLGAGVLALAIDDTGERVALGSADGAVRLVSVDTGQVLARLPERPFLPAALAFDGGGRLIVACSDRCAGEPRAELWKTGSAELQATYTGLSGASFAIAVAPDGVTIAIAEGHSHSIELWNAAELAPIDRLAGVGGPVQAVGISPDGTTLAWGRVDPCPESPICPETVAELEQMLPLPTPARSFVNPVPVSVPAPAFDRAVLASDGLALVAGEVAGLRFPTAGLAILRDGVETADIVKSSQDGYYHAAFSLMPSGAELVTGAGDGALLAYHTIDGGFAGEYGMNGAPGHDGAVLDIAAATARPLLVTGSADQTLRLWNRESRQAIVTLFTTGEEWVLWTPQGYYHSSPAGDRFIGWRVNEGPDKAARFVTARQLKRHLNSPEILRRAVIQADAAAAAKELRGVDNELTALLANRPLDFEVRVLNDGVPIDGQVQVEIVQETVEGAEPEAFSVVVNDRLVSTLGGRDITASRQIIDVPVAPGDNLIAVAGFNSLGYMTERGTFVMNPVSDTPERKGRLFVAVVGVQDYPLLTEACNGRSCDLRYPVADAAGFVQAIAGHTAPMFDQMILLAMVNEDDLAELPDGGQTLLDLLGDGEVLEPDARTVGFELTDFLERPGPEDTTILFVAGHGVNLDEEYYLVPSDGQQRDPGEWRRASLVRWRDIQDAMERAKGRRLLFVDTCHAGNAYNVRLEKDSADARIAVISATAANNVALELPELGHGVFSYSLIRGLDGAASPGRDKIGILDLAAYVSNEVVRLSHDRQTPVYHFPQPVTNFTVAQP